MADEKLQDYPVLVDAGLDFEATSYHLGRGSCNYAVGERKLSSGEVIVFLNQQREGEEVVDTPRGPSRICQHGIVVCGYKVKSKGLLGIFKGSKIRTISNGEREQVESELLPKLKKEPDYVDFW